MIAAIIAALAAGAAASGDLTPQPQAPAPPPAAAKPHKETDLERQNKIECRTMEETGSLLGGPRVCRTHAEWTEQAQRAREAPELQQSMDFARKDHGG